MECRLRWLPGNISWPRGPGSGFLGKTTDVPSHYPSIVQAHPIQSGRVLVCQLPATPAPELVTQRSRKVHFSWPRNCVRPHKIYYRWAIISVIFGDIHIDYIVYIIRECQIQMSNISSYGKLIIHILFSYAYYSNLQYKDGINPLLRIFWCWSTQFNALI